MQSRRCCFLIHYLRNLLLISSRKEYSDFDSMIFEYLPKVSPELSAVEQCWRQGKDDLLVSKYYPRFTNLKTAITNYYRAKRFKLDIAKYLMRESTNLC